MGLLNIDSLVPIKAIPEQDFNRIVLTELSIVIGGLLSLTGETSAERLKTALKSIKNHCGSMNFPEIKKMFELYADNRLSIEPIPNYFDRILLGKIVTAYRMNQRQNDTKTESYQSEKEDKDFTYCVLAFDYHVQNKALPDESVWLFEYLQEFKKVVEFTKKQKKTKYNIAIEKYKDKETAVLKSKLSLVEDFFNNIIAKGNHIKNMI